jgi:DNA polymerase-3 subunit alpha
MENGIKEWLGRNLIDYTVLSKNLFKIEDVGIFLHLFGRDKILSGELELLLTEEELGVNCDYYCYQFGSKYYYQPEGQLKIKDFTLLKYLGKAKTSGMESPFLGVHGGFDILNGSRSYKEWCRKANFLGVEHLGLCEKNTLAGVIKFQTSCIDNKIQPIIGAQYTVKDGDDLTQVKCYVKDERGWSNLLMMNKEVNVENLGFITLRKFLEFTDGLIVVLDPKYLPFEKSIPYDLNIHKGDLFWQLDSVEFENDENDKSFLLRTKEYMGKAIFDPILICDAYYLDEDEYKAKELLNTIADIRDYKSNNQYFKHLDRVLDELSLLFKDQEKFLDIISVALNNVNAIPDRCSFNVPTGVRLLPEYHMTDEEKKKYRTKSNMFLSLIEEGLERKLGDSVTEAYLKQIEEEYDVIAGNDYVDYFLILWDIIKWSRENGILVGIGRGSAGGSLIAYLLDVIEIDPMKFGLLFERFMSHGRAKKSYPDIDTDFEGLRRDDVKKYMEKRYGSDKVCSVGTYTNLKLKQSFKDLSKIYGVSFGTSNYISQIFDIEEGKWADIFTTATTKSVVKDFVQNHPELIEDMQLILNQPKSRSIHACATIIVPDDKDIYHSIPVRKENKGGEDIIISEWEGNELEQAGYLKEDILGVKQLDKYRFILNMIKETTGEEINIYKLPLDDRKVIRMFQEGLTGDIFHFGSPGLTGYCKKMKPESIEDLIAAISLYRPGAMEVNSHNEYILRKTGEKDVEYKFMMESITSETYGLIVYQEQVMKVFQVLADFSLSDADDIRRAIVKKKKELIYNQKEYFLERCAEKGCPRKEAEEIWHEVEVHASYSFNKSHAAAYAITGYIGQWLKVYYPLQFWTSAFEFDSGDPKKTNVNRFISEIKAIKGGIRLSPPHINESGVTFTSNFNKNEIYWSLGKVKQVGDKALQAIINERDKNGEFFSLEEFLGRVDRRVVNKTVVINLILSGAFDDIEDIKFVEQRRSLLNKFMSTLPPKDRKNQYTDETNPISWQMWQKELCGFGEIDYKHLIKNNTPLDHYQFINPQDLQVGDYKNITVVVAGVVTRITERSSAKVGDYANIEIECNSESINLTIWNNTWQNVNGQIGEGNIIIMRGVVKYDSYRDVYAVHSDEDTEIYII